MAEIIDIPPELLQAVSLSWTMDTNHGIAESAFTGATQAQRGQLERWSFTMELRRLSRAEAQAAMGFFMQIEGPLQLFRMYDPSAASPLGRATGTPVLSASASAGDRTLTTSGWTPNVPGILRAGDWIQIGDQLAKVRADVDSSSTGTATLSIWPKMMTAADSGDAIITREAEGLFRFTSDLPAWDARNDNPLRPYTFRLTGVQEVLTD